MSDTDPVVAEVAAANGWCRFRTGDSFVQAWRSFIGVCARGYDMNIYEYENDLSIRSGIQLMLDDERVRNTIGFVDLSTRIAEIDAEFRELLQDGVEVGNSGDPWWKRGVLKEAGAELAADFMEMFGIYIQVV
jgi:hypothetical protein